MDSKVQMPLMELPVRSTVVRDETAQILISPGSQLTSQQLTSLTEISDIVAPNLFHTAGLTKACEAFPKAQVWVPQGYDRNKGNSHKYRFITESSWPYQKKFPIFCIQGMPKVNEVVFFDSTSKSLIVTDLCFNLTETPGLGAWLILNMFGTYKKFGTSRFFASQIKDKPAFTHSIKVMFSKFDFENIYLSHGNNIIGEAKEKLQRALAERNLWPAK